MGGLEQRLENLEHEVRDGFADIGEAIEQMNQRTDDQDKEVEQRFTKLEGQLAAQRNGCVQPVRLSVRWGCDGRLS
jgi:hypothetical protein